MELRYPLKRRLGGPQSGSGRFVKEINFIHVLWFVTCWMKIKCLSQVTSHFVLLII